MENNIQTIDKKIAIKHKNFMLAVLVLIIVIGLVFMGSISQPISFKETKGNVLKIYMNQTLFTFIALALASIVNKIYKKYNEFFVQNYSFVTVSLYVFTIILLLLPWSPLGYTANGATRWIRLGSLSLQPTEIIKPIIVYMLANVLVYSVNEKEIIKILITAPTMIFVIIFMQKSNTSLLQIILLIYLMLCNSSRVKEATKWILAFIGSFLLAIMLVIRSYSYSRISGFIDGTSVQANASVTAIKLGGILGVGIGDGTQKYFFLPEAHNDYVFAAISEEAGFLISVSIVLLFVALIYNMMVLASNMKSRLNRYISFGICYIILNQFLLNILINLNWLPSTGITLPFISYGGSSVVSNLVSIGLFLACVDLEYGDE